MPYVTKPDDPLLDPTKVFDNVYAPGRPGTTVYTSRTELSEIQPNVAIDAAKFAKPAVPSAPPKPAPR